MSELPIFLKNIYKKITYLLKPKAYFWNQKSKNYFKNVAPQNDTK